jgi:hypothetical protein
MTTPEERVREIVRARGLEAEDAERLLASVGRPPARESNPFRRWSGEKTALVAIPVVLVGLLASRLGTRFDGALDLHGGGKEAIPAFTAILDQIIAIPLTAVVLFAAARAISKTVRFVDVLGVVAVSRVVPTALAIPLGFLSRQLPTDPRAVASSVALWALVALAVCALGTQIYLLVQGFATVTAARGRRLGVAFVVGLVVSEIASKAVLAVVHP